MSERSTVHVSGIAPTTTEKEVQDFFSFCGKITFISVTPISGEPDAPKSATVTFEKEAAAKTALLLDQTQLGSSAVHVQAAQTLDDIAGSHAAAAGEAKDENSHEIDQEDKPKSRIVAEYLAHGYVLSDNAIQKAISLDQKHGFSSRFTSALSNFDQKYHATDRARGIDESYKISDKAASGWRGLHSYFEKALGTPSGRKLRDFYSQTDKQVRDIHAEARRLADLKAGKTTQEGGAPAASSAEATGAIPAAAAPAATQPAGTAAPAEPKA
ncbi:hypothetical protein BDV23DRAFT_154308 [Aspergillus alliaceus]|uniref:RRM domain-containing protein n=1 Tax=Petromyces alliaceus TaxID=209559 RepID=A0A5N7C9I0_PETAA|nr:hypothetical protein BDV23DRAFT_154308 [Aspergillus alliaceus]